MGESLKSISGFYSCWYNRLQGVLYLLAFLAFGIGDTITSIWMIEQRGIVREGNFFVQYVIINYGASEFIWIKILVTIVLLFMPFFILKEAAYWILNGYLFSFIVAGILGMILNIQASRNEQLLLSPEQVIFLFIGLVLILTNVGEEIDKRTNPKIRPNIVCLLNDVSTILVTIINTFKKRE